jgi:Uma2 family endonuclease
MPDVSFVAWNQFPNRQLPPEQIWSIYPDLAVEVLSPSNTSAEIDRKAREYFTAGTQLVWIVDPQTQTVRVHSSPDDIAELTVTDTIDGGRVLPGFTMPVAEMFRIE